MANHISNHSPSETEDSVVAWPTNPQDLSSEPERSSGLDRKTAQEPSVNIPQTPQTQKPTRFNSLLFVQLPKYAGDVKAAQGDRSFASDLNLDQIVRAMVKGREEADLITTWFY